MDEVYFLVRYTPFWSIPLLLGSLEFAYIFWLRKKKKFIAGCLIIAFISFLVTVYYYWAGGPEKSVKYLAKFIRYYFS